MIYLSHLLDSKTPSYGGRNPFELERKRSMACGDHANDSFLHMSAHLGTHIDMPLHFYLEGQSIENFQADFWCFDFPLVIELQPRGAVIHRELIEALEILPESKLRTCDMLIVKTGIGAKRHLPEFWQKNPGFSPDLYAYFRSHMPALKVLGFDGISLTGFQNRDLGKVAHQAFLNPGAPILPLEDMRLDEVFASAPLRRVLVSPLRIANCDGLPCTVIGWPAV
jgi:arylformamidase